MIEDVQSEDPRPESQSRETCSGSMEENREAAPRATAEAQTVSALSPGALARGAMMNLEARKAQIARAHVVAVAAAAGYAVYRPRGPLSLGIGAFGPRGIQTPQVELVLCAVCRAQQTTLPLWCPLNEAQFAALTDEEARPSRILVALELPLTPSEWLRQEAGRLVLRRGLYWLNLYGRKGRDPEHLGASLTRANALTVLSLRRLMERLSAGPLRRELRDPDPAASETH